jgi:hypothetical protein
MKIRRLSAIAALVLSLSVAGSAVAADMGMMAGSQMKVAIDRAKLAQKADSLQAVKENLQELVNCIEGPKGSMFKAMDAMGKAQCKGNGLLADAKGAGGKWSGTLPWIELANEIAGVGLKAESVAKARAAAWAAQATLEHADKAMMMRK